MTITVTYTSIDHFRARRTFKTLKAARAFAVHYLGEHPEIGTHYAVAEDGIGKVTVTGCTLGQLFHNDPIGQAFQVWIGMVDEDRGTTGFYLYRSFATLAEANACAEAEDTDGADGVKLISVTPEGKAAIAAQAAAYRAQLFMDREIAACPF
jgi:hypothetical protein